MTKARKLADLGNVYDDGALSNRNLIINGAMQVAQRGTSFASVAASNYTLDRFKHWISGATYSVSQQSFTVGQTDVPNFEYYMRNVVGANTAASDHCIVQQNVEGLIPFDNTDVTFSFWAKASQSWDVGIELARNFGTGGSTRDFVYPTNQTITVGTSWQRYTVTITCPSLSGKTIGTNNVHMEVSLWLSDGGNFSSRSGSIGNQSGTFETTGWQLEVGDTATPFEHRSYGDELHRCMRYFNNIVSYGGSGVTAFLDASAYNSGQNYGTYTFPVTMRAAPTLSYSSLSHFRTRFSNNVTPTILTTHGTTSNKQISVRLDGSSSAGQGGWYEIVSSDAYLYLDAEL